MVKLKLQVLLIPINYEDVSTGDLDRGYIKRFLHLSEPDSELTTVKRELKTRFKKLYPNENELSIEKLQDNDLCDLDPDFTVEDVLSSKDVLRVIVVNSFNTHPSFQRESSTPHTERKNKASTPLTLTKNWGNPRDAVQNHEPPKAPVDWLTSPTVLENRKQDLDYFETPNSNIPSKLARKSQSQFHDLPLLNTRADEADESNITLPPPDQDSDHEIPVKGQITHSAVLPGKRITSGMLNVPPQKQIHTDAVDVSSKVEISSSDSSSEEESEAVSGSNHNHVGPQSKLVEPTLDFSINSSPRKTDILNSDSDISVAKEYSDDSESSEDISESEPAKLAQITKTELVINNRGVKALEHAKLEYTKKDLAEELIKPSEKGTQDEDTISRGEIFEIFHAKLASKPETTIVTPQSAIIKALAIDMIDAVPQLGRNTTRAAARRATNRIPVSLQGKPLLGIQESDKPNVNLGSPRKSGVPLSSVIQVENSQTVEHNGGTNKSVESVVIDPSPKPYSVFTDEAHNPYAVFSDAAKVSPKISTVPVGVIITTPSKTENGASSSNTDDKENKLITSEKSPDSISSFYENVLLRERAKLSQAPEKQIGDSSGILQPEPAQAISSTSITKKPKSASDPAQSRIRKLVNKFKQFDKTLSSHIVPGQSYIKRLTQIPFESDSEDDSEELILDHKIVLGKRKASGEGDSLSEVPDKVVKKSKPALKSNVTKPIKPVVVTPVKQSELQKPKPGQKVETIPLLQKAKPNSDNKVLESKTPVKQTDKTPTDSPFIGSPQSNQTVLKISSNALGESKSPIGPIKVGTSASASTASKTPSTDSKIPATTSKSSKSSNKPAFLLSEKTPGGDSIRNDFVQPLSDKKRKFEDSSSDESDSSSESEVEEKKPRVVVPTQRSQSPINGRPAIPGKPVTFTPVKAPTAKVAQSVPAKSSFTPKAPLPKSNLSKSATKAAVRKPVDQKKPAPKIKKPVLNSLDDLALRGVPEVKESIGIKPAAKAAPVESEASESDSDSSSGDDSGSDSENDIKFISVKSVASSAKKSKNFFGKMKR